MKKVIVYIIDNFEVKTIDLTADSQFEVSHGECVEAILTAYNKDIKSERLNLKEYNSIELSNQFQRVLNDINNGKHVDAVVMPFEFPLKISLLDEKIDKDLSRGNLEDYNDKIREWLESEFPDAYRNIVEIEKITELGVKVYISAGNSGAGYLNVFNLAKNTYDVGVDAQGTELCFYCNNQLVNYHEKASFEVKQTEDGFDFDGDGKVNLKIPCINGNNKISTVLKGTSFSVALYAAKDLIKK